MEKINHYRTIIKEVMAYIGSLGIKPGDPVQSQLIEDDRNGHYLVFTNGWRGELRHYGCRLHIDLAPDGKVWLQHDGTDLVVADMLIEKGIPTSDIVLGFYPPIVRPETGFAVS